MAVEIFLNYKIICSQPHERVLKINRKAFYYKRLSVDICKKESGQRVSGFFTKSGQFGMIEAADYEQIDLVAPLSGENVEVCCENTRKAQVTEVSTLYFYLVNKVF